MMPSLLHLVPTIPRLTALGDQAECLAQLYTGWELLEADDPAAEILICKPCPPWEYTKSKNLLILYGEAAVAWQRHFTVLH
jgi:hypothetical protein